MEEKIKSEMLALLLKQGVLGFTATTFNSAAFIYLSWDYVNRTNLIAWFVVISMVNVVRASIHWNWAARKQQVNEREAGVLINKLIVGLFIVGLIWGVTPLFWLQQKSNFHLAATAFILAGMSAGAVAAFGISLMATLSYIIPSLTPLIVVLLIQNSSEYFVLGLMALLYCLLTGVLAYNFHKTTNKVLKLNIENEELIGRIRSSRHEIRTPVAAINGFASLLVEAPGRSDVVLQYAKIIQRNSVYLRKLVENILFHSANEAESVEDHESLILKDEIDSSLKMIEAKAREKKLIIEGRYSSDVPDIISTNSLKFQQVLTNLLNNAIKYTEQGKITVTVKVSQGEFLIIEITDTGIGINPEAQKLIFESYFRENRVEVARQEGSGLGLPLSKKLAQSLGGDLQLISSIPNKGSTFEFKIPLEISDKNPQHRLEGRKIVVVDDSKDILALFKNRLEKEGAIVEVCSDGQKAIDFLDRNHEIDLVLMDLNMPGIDGYCATKIIRDHGFAQPIVAFATSTDLTTEDCRKSGFSSFIDKSKNFEQNLRVIERLK